MKISKFSIVLFDDKIDVLYRLHVYGGKFASIRYFMDIHMYGNETLSVINNVSGYLNFFVSVLFAIAKFSIRFFFSRGFSRIFFFFNFYMWEYV